LEILAGKLGLFLRHPIFDFELTSGLSAHAGSEDKGAAHRKFILDD